MPLPTGHRLTSELSWVWILYYDRRSVCQSVLEQSTHLGLTTRFLLLSDSCGFVDVGRSLWRENGSVGYNCCWSSPARSFRGKVPWDSWPYFTVSDLRLPFRRLLRLAGSQWMYSTPPPHRMWALNFGPLISPWHGPTENRGVLLLRALPSNGHCLQCHRLVMGLWLTHAEISAVLFQKLFLLFVVITHI
jgi:hypothetical protein